MASVNQQKESNRIIQSTYIPNLKITKLRLNKSLFLKYASSLQVIVDILHVQILNINGYIDRV